MRRAKRLLLLFLVIVAIAHGSFVPTGGRGYFSPDILESRSQTEYRLRWGRFHYHQAPLVEYLVAKKFWESQSADSPRWFEVFHWNYSWHGGYDPFYKQLNWYAKEWIEWSETKPELAAAAWPRVLAVLRSDERAATLTATAMMHAARTAKDVSEFKRILADEGLER